MNPILGFFMPQPIYRIYENYYYGRTKKETLYT